MIEQLFKEDTYLQQLITFLNNIGGGLEMTFTVSPLVITGTVITESEYWHLFDAQLAVAGAGARLTPKALNGETVGPGGFLHLRDAIFHSLQPALVAPAYRMKIASVDGWTIGGRKMYGA